MTPHKTLKRATMFANIQHAVGLAGGGTLIIVDADQGPVRAGDTVSFRLPKTRGGIAQDAIVQNVESFDRPMSWGLSVDCDVQDLIMANVGAKLMIVPDKDI